MVSISAQKYPSAAWVLGGPLGGVTPVTVNSRHSTHSGVTSTNTTAGPLRRSRRDVTVDERRPSPYKLERTHLALAWNVDIRCETCAVYSFCPFQAPLNIKRSDSPRLFDSALANTCLPLGGR